VGKPKFVCTLLYNKNLFIAANQRFNRDSSRFLHAQDFIFPQRVKRFPAARSAYRLFAPRSLEKFYSDFTFSLWLLRFNQTGSGKEECA
jgi:hypothetical protein